MTKTNVQQGQFADLQQLLETLLLTRLGMFQRGFDPQARRVLTGTESREQLWAQAVAQEILAARVLLARAPDGGQAEVPLGRLAEAAAGWLAECQRAAAALEAADPGLVEALPAGGTLAQLLAEFLRRREGA